MHAISQKWFELWQNKHNAWWVTPVVVFLFTRVIIFAAAYIAEVSLTGNVGEGYYHVAEGNVLVDVWARWDSGFYLDIATDGYQYSVGQQSSVAFFPLYPLLMNWLTPVFGSAIVAGIFVSNIALLAALLFLYRLTTYELDVETADRTVFYITAFPTAFFFSAVYTESLFLLFAVGTMYFARQRLWEWAILFAMLCTGTRIVGILCYGVVGLEWLNAHGWYLGKFYQRESWHNLLRAIKTDWKTLALIQISPLGLASYMFFLYRQFGDPLAFSTVQAAWGRQQRGPIVIIYQELAKLAGGDFFSGAIWYHVIFDLGAAFVVFALIGMMWRKLGESYAAYSLLAVLIPLSSGSGSISRYVLVVFPLFMLLGYIGRYRFVHQALSMLFIIFLGIFTTLFVNWVFVA